MLWGKHLLQQLGIKQKQHDYNFGSWPIRKSKVHLSKWIKKYTTQANNQSTFKCQLHFNLSLSSPSVWVLSIIDCNGRLFLRQNLLQRYCGITSTMTVRQICINANTHSSMFAHIAIVMTDMLRILNFEMKCAWWTRESFCPGTSCSHIASSWLAQI